MTDKATSDLWWKNTVIYCVDPFLWLDSNGDGVGDLAGLTRRLDYLAALGVTCLWLLPFYPSPRRDGGYDVVDHYGVDARVGTHGDFVELMRTADRLGMSVLLDLVLNHTSDEHPWFVDARRGRSSPHHSYYVWRDEPLDVPDVVFPGVQEGTWTRVEKVGRWYLHRYYSFMPDLNIANAAVRDEMNKIVGFWLQLGVSGFRVDSLPFLLETTGLPEGEKPRDTLKEMREFLTRRKGDAIFLGEANIAPDQQARYFGDKGTEGVHMLFDYTVNAAVWLGLARGDATPIARSLRQRPPNPTTTQYVTFLRHHDELSLESLEPENREEVFRAFGPRPEHQIYGRGLRRRAAPMLDGDLRRMRLALSLTLSLPGTPMLYYGDELGMGEDLSRHGRDSVRLPMQWDDRRNGGFSRAEPDRLSAPPVADGPFGYRATNAAHQRRDPGSLFTWTSRAVHARRECPELGWGEWRTVDTGDSRVLAVHYTWHGGRMLVLHNLSDARCHARFPDDLTGDDSIGHVEQVLGDGDPPEGLGDGVELAPHGYRWLRLVDADVTTTATV